MRSEPLTVARLRCRVMLPVGSAPDYEYQECFTDLTDSALSLRSVPAVTPLPGAGPLTQVAALSHSHRTPRELFLLLVGRESEWTLDVLRDDAVTLITVSHLPGRIGSLSWLKSQSLEW